MEHRTSEDHMTIVNFKLTESELTTIFDALDAAMDAERDADQYKKMADISDRIYEFLDNLHAA